MAHETILLVDDEPEIIEFIKVSLNKEAFTVATASCGNEALSQIKNQNPDLIVLDVMLPDIDGVELSLQIRRLTDIPIIFLSCKSEDIDKVLALSAGGDDYLTKPFSVIELVARIKAHLRRNRIIQNNKPELIEENNIIKKPSITVNLDTREVFISENSVNLSAKEFDMLSLLIQNPKRIYSVEQIYELIWKTDCLSGDSRSVIVYIGNIRKKIEPDLANPKYILNIRGVGYKFNHNL